MEEVGNDLPTGNDFLTFKLYPFVQLPPANLHYAKRRLPAGQKAGVSIAGTSAKATENYWRSAGVAAEAVMVDETRLAALVLL